MGDETLSVVCGACGAKYGIPRDKVKGRVLRVPCKRCGASLIVHGDEAPASDPAPTPAPVAPAATAPTEQVGPFDDQFESPFDGQPESPFDEKPEPGLFGEGKTGFFSSQGQAGTAEVLSSAGEWDGGLFGAPQPAPAAAPGKFGSVLEPASELALFSLANLQTLSADTPGPAAAPAPGLLAAVENSGLVDIRSLATGEEEADGAMKKSHLDELVSMGTTPFAPALGVPVLAPVLTPARGGMGLGAKLGIGLTALGLVTGIAVAAVIFLREGKPKPDTAAQELAMLRQQVEELQASGGSQSRKMAELQTQLEAKQKAAVGGVAVPAAVPVQVPDKKDEVGAAGRKAGAFGKARGAAEKGGDTGSEEAEDTQEERPIAQKPVGGKRNAELDSMLGDSIAGAEPKKKAAPQPVEKSETGALPETLERADVQAGMAGVADRVANCGQGQAGTVSIRVIIGNDGRVLDARATGEFAGTPIGQCAARTLLAAKFPRFTNPKLIVTYPFKIE
ncbi:MAG: hypothetical protein PHU25_13235 [Deltaproteobacteria bacterium]|nr:hypothetical protein [Deltaproteobacteria bacterium]